MVTPIYLRLPPGRRPIAKRGLPQRRVTIFGTPDIGTLGEREQTLPRKSGPLGARERHHPLERGLRAGPQGMDGGPLPIDTLGNVATYEKGKTNIAFRFGVAQGGQTPGL